MMLGEGVVALLFTTLIVGATTDVEISTGTVLQLVLITIALASVFAVSRYRAALEAQKATAEAWREERDAERSKADRLELIGAEARAKMAALEARPDMTEVVRALDKVVHHLEQHETSALDRFERVVSVLDVIVTKMHPHSKE